MAKKVAGSFKLQLKAGEASMAPPVGPAFGQRGLNGMEFVKQFNGKTGDKRGNIFPIVVTFYADKSFNFVIKSSPASVLLKKAAGLDKGSPESNKVKVGKVTRKQLEEIVEIKKDDLNAFNLDAACDMLAGTARSCGIVDVD